LLLSSPVYLTIGILGSPKSANAEAIVVMFSARVQWELEGLTQSVRAVNDVVALGSSEPNIFVEIGSL
jgi:hypothetical protein